jgi:hypothetical protein
MTFFSSFDISLVAIQQSSVEDVLAGGMLVADVLVLADDCALLRLSTLVKRRSIACIMFIYSIF